MTRIHRRQFILGPKPRRVHDDWVVEELEGGLFLSRCPELRAASSTDRDGASWRLLGCAVQSAPERPDPVEEISLLGSEDVRRAYRSWAGRWVLMGAGELHMDATGLLGCHYRPGKAGERTWASSSPVLLALGEDGRGPDASSRTLRHNKGVDWYPPPRSRFAGVRRLLPSQVLRLDAGTPEHRRLIPDPPAGPGYEDLLDAIAERLRTALRAIARQVRDTLWLPLTGGHDSRMLLAIGSDLGLPLRCYTQRFPGMPLADRILPRRLARAAGVPHRLIQPGGWDDRRAELYWAHNGRHTPNDLDRRFFAHGQWAFTRRGDVLLRSGGIEVGVGRNKYFADFPPALPDVADLLEGLHEPLDSPAAEGLGEWLEWLRTGAEPTDWRHRLYLEQRIGGWLSSIEQSLDLVDPERFYPGNAAETYALLTAVPKEMRRDSRHQKDLIRRLAHELDRFPYNPHDDELGRLRGLAYRIKDDPSLLLKGPLRKARRAADRLAGRQR